MDKTITFIVHFQICSQKVVSSRLSNPLSPHNFKHQPISSIPVNFTLTSWKKNKVKSVTMMHCNSAERESIRGFSSASTKAGMNVGCYSCLCFVLNCCRDVFQFVVFCGLRTCIVDVGCFFCICFVLHCCFDVYEFVQFCGLDSCTLDTGCCVLNCYFDNVDFHYYVYYLSFQSSSCQHLLSTNPFTVV
ncbi:hypothetical protein P9112_008728 [Eukaryota sp. TZLM1-RC]